jgi:hypothetical protein
MRGVLAAGAILIAASAGLWYLTRPVPPAPLTVPAAAPAPLADVVQNPRQYFLRDSDLPDGTWLLLAPAAFLGRTPTDDDPAFRVVRDTALLRDVASQVWYDNDDSNRGELLLLSFVFMSPPANSTDGDFAYLVRPDGQIERWTYFIPASQGQGKGPLRDLGPLVAASEPVFYQSSWVATRAEYDTLVAQIAAEDTLLTLEPLPLPDPHLGFSRRTFVQFPSLILPTAEMTEARIAAETAAAKALFTERFGPPGESYEPLALSDGNCEPPVLFDPVNDVPIWINDAIVELPGFSTLTLEGWVYADLAFANRMVANAQAFGQAVVPPAFDAAFAALVADKLGAVSVDDYKLVISCFSEGFQADFQEDNTQYLGYYQIGAGAAQ